MDVLSAMDHHALNANMDLPWLIIDVCHGLWLMVFIYQIAHN